MLFHELLCVASSSNFSAPAFSGSALVVGAFELARKLEAKFLVLSSALHW